MGVEMNLLEILNHPERLLESKGRLVGPGRWVTIKGKHIFQRGDKGFRINRNGSGPPKVTDSKKTQDRQPRQDKLKTKTTPVKKKKSAFDKVLDKEKNKK